MENFTKPDILDKIEETTDDLDFSLELLEQVESDDTSMISLTSSIQNKCEIIATYSSFAGNRLEAEEWFARGSQYSIKFVTSVERLWSDAKKDWRWEMPRKLSGGLLMAIIARDDDSLSQVVNTALEMDDRHYRQFEIGAAYYKPKALAALIAGDHRFSEYLDGARDGTGKELARTQFDVMETIHQQDSDAVAAAIERLLELHEQKTTGRPGKSTDVMDHDATAFVILARQHDISVQPESPYIPSVLVDYDSGPNSIPNA